MVFSSAATFASSAARVSAMNALAWRTWSGRLPGCTCATKSRANLIGKSIANISSGSPVVLAQLAPILLGQVVAHRLGRLRPFARARVREAARRGRAPCSSLTSTVRSISSGSTVIGSSSTSGVTPTPWIDTSPGSVRYCAIVSLSAALSGRSLEDELHAPLAERRLADDDGAVVVLHRAGDDLARAGRRAVHEHRDRVVGLGPLAVRDLLLAPLARVAHRGDDRPLGDELVGDPRRLIEQPAGVAAQIEHEALAARRSSSCRRAPPRDPPPCSAGTASAGRSRCSRRGAGAPRSRRGSSRARARTASPPATPRPLRGGCRS